MTLIKNFSISILFLTGISIPSFSQTNSGSVIETQNLKDAIILDGNLNSYDNRFKGIKGTPFIIDKWLPGSVNVKTKSGKSQTFENVLLKYNALDNLLLAVMQGSKDTIVLNNAAVPSFTLGVYEGKTFITFAKFKEAAKIDQALSNIPLAILHQGKVNFLKHHSKTLLKPDATSNTGYGTAKTYEEIVDKTQYFILYNGNFEKIRLNKKNILSILPEKDIKALEAYVKSQKLVLNNEEDVIKLFTYHETL